MGIPYDLRPPPRPQAQTRGLSSGGFLGLFSNSSFREEGRGGERGEEEVSGPLWYQED